MRDRWLILVGAVALGVFLFAVGYTEGKIAALRYCRSILSGSP